MKITKEIIKQLKKGGYADDRIQAIIKEANTSSNPEYILNYWGVKMKYLNNNLLIILCIFNKL